MCVETNQISPQQTIQQILTFGQHPEQLIGRKGYVVEIPDTHPGLKASKQAGQKHELIIVHPCHVTIFQIGAHHICKKLIDSFVSFPIGSFILDIGIKVMTKRPNDTVAVSFVI